MRLLLALVLLSQVLVNAQTTSELRLRVLDASGSGMAANGELRGDGKAKPFRTDAGGSYVFAGLAPGNYEVQVIQRGFSPQTVALSLAAGGTLNREIRLTPVKQFFQLEVVSATPLPGLELQASDVAAPVQRASAEDIERSAALDLSDFMNRRLNGVYLNEIQSNPYQPDVNYRGYTASPLLGTPQGLSVYLDGVRLNQPFGDVVSWDLIPRLAIGELSLIPGSNPVFGLNTLGGALSVETKSGFSYPHTSVNSYWGNYQRRAIEFDHGGATAKGYHYYLAANLFAEDGWRDASPSDVRQILGKIGRQGTKSSVSLTYSHAANSLTGNGLQEKQLLERNYSSIYTKPDVTDNHANFVNLSLRRSLTPRWNLHGNAYFRNIRTNTLNGDLNDDSLDQSVYQVSAAERAALTAAGYTGIPTTSNAANTPFPFWRCIANALLGDEPAEKCNGLLNRSRGRQYNYGVSGQLSSSQTLWGRANQFVAGFAHDRNAVRFGQSTELGYLNPDRSVTGVNAFGDGKTGGDVDGEPFDVRVDLRGKIRTYSVYATNNLALAPNLHLTLSGRLNHTSVSNRDRINPGGGRGSLDGDHSFLRFNPAVGLTYSPKPFLNAYVSYSEGSRAPTSIELGCADPEEPCRLPNSLAGDPPLEQVVTRTFETGLRAAPESRLRWNASYYLAENRNDILFVASRQVSFGYFKNFGQTRRQGLELGLSSRWRRADYGLSYSLLEATFQSQETVNGASSSSNDARVAGLAGFIQIQPGDLIPLTPRHSFKAFSSIELTKRLAVNVNVLALSGSLARGNENGKHQPDGRIYLGPGNSPAYGIVNLGGTYKVLKALSLFVQAQNLFDQRYYTGSQLGTTGFTAAGTFQARPFAPVGGEYPLVHSTFFAPGAPRLLRGGIRLFF